MRLHKLELERFGPFAQRVSLDLDALTEQGLFLLHGPTGAGKTSLLDAVCFALYGSVPGAREKTERLTSDHAVTDGQPEVLCEFSASGRRFEVTRSPAWDRPKSRGTGTVKQPASVLVREWCGGQWLARADRLDEAGLLLADVLGMAKDQFTKVVLLPQGDFAAFLRAKADERRQLLEKLFGTQRFTDIENWLAEHRNAAKADLAERATRRGDLLARADEHARVLADQDGAAIAALAALPDDLADAATVELATQWRDAAAAERARAAAESEAVGEQLIVARAEASAVAERLRAARGLEDLLGRYRDLLAHEPELREMRSRRDAASRAEPLRARLRALDELRSAAVSAERDRALADEAAAVVEALPSAVATSADGAQTRLFEAATTDLTQLSFDIDAAEEGGLFPEFAEALPLDDVVGVIDESTSAQIAARRQLLGRLDAEVTRESELTETETTIARLDRELLDLDTEIGGLSTVLTDNREQVEAQSVERASLQQVAATLDDRVVTCEGARRQATAATTAARLAPLVAEAVSADEVARDAELSAREHHLNLFEARLEGMAGELATALTDGAPCPVCGSCEHPEPAGAQRRVTAEEVSTAKLAEQAAREAAAIARRQRDELAAEHAEAVTVSGGLTVEAAETQVRRASTLVRQAESARARLGVLDDEITKLTQLLDQTSTLVTEKSSHRVELRTTRDRLSEVRDKGAAALVDARAGFTTVEARVASLSAEIEMLERLQTAQSAHEASLARLTDAEHSLQSDCLAQGFESVTAATGCLLPTAERSRLTSEVDEAATALSTVRERLNELRDDALAFGLATEAEADRWVPESLETLASAQAALGRTIIAVAESAERADNALTTTQTRAHELAGRLNALTSAARNLTELSRHLRELTDATAPLREEYARLDELTGTAHGLSSSNSRRLRLSAFVLEARLEQVALAASERLQVMSDGRYTLLHSQSRGRGGGRSGLGLRVMDSWTSLERDTASLSGGESFVASLALALGLADVVHAESGGIAIETLFIDEGFGTLDDETLELVMEVLDQLREGGRAVGVVSHVSELRTRIPAQVQVVKGLQGSSVQQADAVAS